MGKREVATSLPDRSRLLNEHFLGGIVVLHFVLYLGHLKDNKAYLDSLLLVRGMKGCDESGIMLSQHRCHLDLFHQRIFKGKDELLVVKPCRVLRVREAIAWCPLVLEFHTECRVWEVTHDEKDIEHFGEIVYGHHENAIYRVPSMNVPLIVAVAIEQVQVIELGLDILRPRTRVSIAERTVPLL